MMKMKNRFWILWLPALIAQITFSQSEGLTSSPYSLYGLGTINQTSIGISNGLGHSGIGLKQETGINNLNPANFALAPKNSFFYDIGIKGELNHYDNRGDGESKTTLNFSNLAFAFRITEGLGAGVTMIPYSDVGYSLLGLSSNIEGSNESFESNVYGLGGLSDLSINLGYSLTESLRLGFTGSFLFGNIEETESFVISRSYLELTETNNYSGFRIGFGTHWDIGQNITLGGVLKLPVTLNGNLTRTVAKILDGEEIVVVDAEADNDVSDFKLPMELGFGISARLKDSFTLTADYRKSFWDATHQSEHIGTYTDQDTYAFGLQYLNNQRAYKYWKRIGYRAGFNYDNGYLALNDQKIDGYTFTAGLGLPIGVFSNSMINLSYGYSSKGYVQNILVREKYHTLAVNLSLEDLWFKKRKIN